MLCSIIEQAKPVIEEVKTEAPVIIQIAQEDRTKKCCSIMKEDVHIAGKCCAYTWCCTLNGIECCCMSMSKCCIILSDIAIACNKFLEAIDCDKH